MTNTLTFAKAQALLGSARVPTAGKPIANNTRVVMQGDSGYAVRLHKTNVLTFHANGDVEYQSGGWRSVTTKERMNRFGPARIWSDRGTWYIIVGKAFSRQGDPDAVPYADGCRVTADGRIVGAGSESSVTKEARLRRDIGKYAAAYVSALYAGDIPAPGAGDCWCCSMVASDGSRPMGGLDHIVGHIQERYFVPSLIWNAISKHGAAFKNDVAILQKFDSPTGARLFAPDGGFIRKDLQTAIRKHCLRECGLAA